MVPRTGVEPVRPRGQRILRGLQRALGSRSHQDSSHSGSCTRGNKSYAGGRNNRVSRTAGTARPKRAIACASARMVQVPNGAPLNHVRGTTLSAGTNRRTTLQSCEFIDANRTACDPRATCHALDVTRSGLGAWPTRPLSDRATEDARLLGLVRASFVAGHGTCRALRVRPDLREAGNKTVRTDSARTVGPAEFTAATSPL